MGRVVRHTLRLSTLSRDIFRSVAVRIAFQRRFSMSKLCFLCGKEIGFVRTFWDQHYCSAEHRREARLASSQALREEEEIESWTIERSRKRQKPVGSGPTAGQTASAFAFLTVVGLLVVAVLLP